MGLLDRILGKRAAGAGRVGAEREPAPRYLNEEHWSVYLHRGQ